MVVREVFVSHASVDGPHAMALVDSLEAGGTACWVAPRDVGSGRDYTEEIVEGLRGARVVVLLASAGSYQSQHVKRELRLAVEMNVLIVPVQLDDAPLPAAFSYCLSGSQRLDARGSKFTDWAAEVEVTIAHLTGDPEVQAPGRSTGTGRAGRLPLRLDAFIGRDAEVRELGAGGETRSHNARCWLGPYSLGLNSVTSTEPVAMASGSACSSTRSTTPEPEP